MAQQDSPARRADTAARRQLGGARFWLRSVAAGALVLMLGLGQAYADAFDGIHQSGGDHDKGRGLARSAMHVAAQHGSEQATAHAQATTKPAEIAAPDDESASDPASIDVASATPDDESGARTRTRTVTRTFTRHGNIISVTRSKSVSFDDEGNRAVAKAFAKARAPEDVEAVENGAGKVVAKTSVDVKGNGSASADAGGSISVDNGKVEVSTWGRTSAEVF
ncbi:MAG: hypothetical protein R3D05_07910 [Dongiaceae bacterium]